MPRMMPHVNADAQWQEQRNGESFTVAAKRTRDDGWMFVEYGERKSLWSPMLHPTAAQVVMAEQLFRAHYSNAV